jgi:hypothetical protein
VFISVRFAVVFALLVQLLEGRRVAQLNAIDRLEVGRGHLTAEGLEGSRIGFVSLAQRLVGDVRQDRGKVRNRFRAAPEELRAPARRLQREFGDPVLGHAPVVDTADLKRLAGHLHERQAHVLAPHLLGAPLVVLAAPAQQFAGLRMLRQEELRIVA